MIAVLLLIGCFSASASTIAGLNYLGSMSWRRSEGQHWTERARLLYPIRASGALNPLLIAACAILGNLAAGKNWRDLWPIYGFVAFCGALLGSYPLDHWIFPEIKFKEWLVQVLFVWGSRLLIFGPLVLVAAFLPQHWDWNVVLVVFLSALWHLWIITVGFMKVLRWIGALKPFPSEFAAVFQECFEMAKMVPRRLWLIPTRFLYAAALPVTRELIFSEGMLSKCSEAELRSICFHELAHLSEDRRVVIKRIVGNFTLFPFVLIKPSVGTWGFFGMSLIYVVVGLLMVFNRRLGRSLEVRADDFAAGQEANEGAYAKTLEKLYRLNQMPAVMASTKRIHPHLYDRMLAAGVNPDYERPKAPDYFNWTIFLPIVVGIALWYLIYQS